MGHSEEPISRTENGGKKIYEEMGGAGETSSFMLLEHEV